MVAFTGQVGAPAAAGPLLALVAAGSLVARPSVRHAQLALATTQALCGISCRAVGRYVSARTRAQRRTHDARLYLGRRGDSAYAHRRLHFGSEASAFRSTHGGTQLDDHSAGRGGSGWGMDGGAHRR